MSTLQHINSVIDHFWPEYQRRFPAFEKPEIVPAETLRGMAPVYMRRNIDQDPTSFYMFVRANPMNGDASRERMKELVDDLFYEKLGMPSSYEVDEGYSREEAIDKEVLPAANDSEYRRYYDEQMSLVAANNDAQDSGRSDDDDIIDLEIGADGIARATSDRRDVGQARTTAVGMPKQIWYAVDFHCPAGGMLGYNGGGAGGRLGGGRGGRRFLREADSPVSDILAAYKGLSEELKKDVEQIATGPDGAVVVKHKGGKFTVVEDGKAVMERVSADEIKKSGKLGNKQVTVVTKDEIGKMLSECDDADPEKMMKEFVEKKNGEVEEDEYRRPKNQPHNLHQVDEGEDVEEDEYRRPKNQPHNLH